jgi:hypothetical protein
VTVSDIYASREQTTYEIGYGASCGGGVNVTPSIGLCDASGIALRNVLSSYGQATEQGWLDFDTVYSIASTGTGMMSGASWYHWVALRGVQGSTLWIANSAPGYKGIWDNLSRDDFNRLGGFSVVWLV